MARVVRPPLGTRKTGRTPYEVAEIRPTTCDGGHEIAIDAVGWHTCLCGGHRTYWCRCGQANHFHTAPEPRPACSVKTADEIRER